ncbi:MAG: TolC family protein [Bacteroidales bacterium]|nr:TolC family protein [Bacteroidales bacterium]
MKRKILTGFLFLLTISFTASAQKDAESSTLSFDNAIKEALRNNPELRIRELNYKMSVEQLKESKLQLVPQIYGRYDVRHNIIIPSTLVPVGKFNPSLPPDETVPIKFGTSWYSGAGLFASVSLFDPSIIGDIREKNASVALSELERKITEKDLEYQAGRAYIACLISSEQYDYAVEDTLNSYNQLMETKRRVDGGFLKITDLNQAVLNHNNAVSRLNDAKRIVNDSWKTLAYWMGYPQDQQFNPQLTDSLSVLIERFSTGIKAESDLLSTPELALLKKRTDIDNLRLRNIKYSFLPTVSLSAVYAGDFYNNNLRLSDKDYWFGNSNISLSLKIPITEGISRVKKLSRQKLMVETAGEDLLAELNKKQLELNRNRDNMIFYMKEMSLKDENMKISTSNYKAAFGLFREGRILPSELTGAELSLKQAKFDYLNSVFSFIESVLEFKRITGS